MSLIAYNLGGSSFENCPAAGSGGGSYFNEELLKASEGLHSPEEILSWAKSQFPGDILVACSFQDAVLIDLVAKYLGAVEVVFIDTGSHFPETLEYFKTLEKAYSLDVTLVRPKSLSIECGSANCCNEKKVKPFDNYLKQSGKKAWVSGIKRADTPERSNALPIEWDERRNMYKVNPLIYLSEKDIENYVNTHRLPEHPLRKLGYLSIGCAPVTRPALDPSDPRSGRWPGVGKTECGLHIN
jgi:phosphoadenosine phosphosulfate reductase